ncbi:MAG: biopolymer transporter ExbD [Spirochaetales bacterium]|nr:biopolymer transporter ExbD [Spirochaetales bacterium]
MNTRKRKRRHSDISDSGALSDLAFLLIVFFIVVAVLNVNRGFLMQLPRKDSARVVNVDDLVKISLLEDGRITCQDKELLPEELEELVTDTISVRPNMTMLLDIHPEVSYQEVVGIIELVKKLHVENFSFRMMADL